MCKMIGKWIFAYTQEKSVRYYIADLHFYHENLNQHMDCRGFRNAEAMNEYMIARWNSRVRNNDEVVILGDFSISPNGSEVNRILERLQGKKFLIRGNHERYLESRKFDPGHFGWIEDYKELRDNKRKVVLSHYPIMCYNGQYRVHDSGGKVGTQSVPFSPNAKGGFASVPFSPNAKGGFASEPFSPNALRSVSPTDGRNDERSVSPAYAGTTPVTYMLYGHVHNTFDEWLINEYQNMVHASKTITRDSNEAVPIPCRMINCFCMFSDYVPLTLDEWIRVDEARRSVLNGAG